MKQRIWRLIPICALLLLSVPPAFSLEGTDSLRFEILLTNKMLKDLKIEEKLISNFEITPGRLILLSTKNQFYILGWGGLSPLGQKQSGDINSFSFTSDKLLMVLQNTELCGMDTAGNLSGLFKLPYDNMGISPGEYVMYLYDRRADKANHSVYIIAPGGNYAKLFDIPSQINSLIEYNNSILLASGNAIFRYDPPKKELKIFAALTDDQKIVSLTADSANNRVYFSTQSNVYALKDSVATIISDQFGGSLRYFNGGLLVFNPEKAYLIRILGVEDNMALKIRAAGTNDNGGNSTGILSNSAIVNLTGLRVSDDEIIGLINNSPVNFNTSVDSMIYLSEKNVSSAVILAMRNAMKRKGRDVISAGNAGTQDRVVENSQPVQNTAAQVPNDLSARRFYIIVGSYPTEEKADEAVADLRMKGFSNAKAVGKSDSGTFRIASKGYDTIEEATKDLADVRQKLNPSAWIYEIK